uniref:Uncharacterized protein n=1 Tax=Heterorhabditis bacteriophora TaxID=37862 RepID=A0A1I7XPB6_HETBA
MTFTNERSKEHQPKSTAKDYGFAGPELESGAGGEEVGTLGVQFKMLLSVLIRLGHWTMPLMLQGSRRLLKGSTE